MVLTNQRYLIRYIVFIFVIILKNLNTLNMVIHPTVGQMWPDFTLVKLIAPAVRYLQILLR